MPKLNDHGLGGGGKGIGVPVFPFNAVEGYVTRDNGTLRMIYGDNISIPQDSYGNCGCANGDEIYLMGMKSNYQVCYKYNVKTKMWTGLTNSPYDFQKYWAVSHGAFIYYGGNNSGVYRYNTLTNAHSVLISNINHNMAYSRAVIDGDYIYIFGGNGSSTYRTYATRVDITNQTYTRLADIPIGMYNHGVANGGDGYIYLFGGMDSSTKAYKYNIADNSYTNITDIPFNCYGQMTTKVDNYIYLINSVHSLYQQVIYLFDVSTGTYTSLGNTINARQYGVVGVVDDGIYMLGGGTGTLTYLSGESVIIGKFISANLARQLLVNGCKVHTNGDVGSGVFSEFDGLTIFKTETTIEKVNGVATIPNNGEYALIGASYATIEG